MARIAPKGRKHLSADALLAEVRRGFATIPDHRLSKPEIPLADALMAAFAWYSLKSPSLLAFDHQRTEGNLHTIYGIERVPCDTAMREILDPVAPAALRPVFTRLFRHLQLGKALESLTFFDGHYVVALDGTGYFSSKTIPCASCLQKVHRTGSITYAHQMVGAALIHPDCRAVIPLMPEPIVKQEGTAKNDCDRNATKRLIAQLRHDHPHLRMIVTADSLSSHAPHIETLHESGCHSILGVKEGDHASLFQQVQAAQDAGQVTTSEHADRAAGVGHRFHFLNDLPLHESHAAVRVNFIEYWELGAQTTQHFSWVTDLRVSTRNVYTLMRGGRARWKIENETFNTLKNQGYHFTHNYGHGPRNLSVLFARLMMLAFLVDQIQQLGCALFQAVRVQLGSHRLLWERMRAVFYDYALTSLRHLWETPFYGIKKNCPTLALDSS
jgi:hypothetical protein